MSSDEPNSGDPLRYPENGPYRDSVPVSLAVEVQRQVDELTQRPAQPTVRHELLRLMQQRRAQAAPVPPGHGGRAEPGQLREHAAGAGGGGVAVQFDYLPVAQGWDTLLVRGELLITAESYEAAQPYLVTLGMTAEQPDCEYLRGEVLRLVHRAGRDYLSASQLADIASDLRQRGHNAAITNAAPTAPVSKAHGGPRPALPHSLPEPGQARGPKVAVIDTGISRQRQPSVSPGSQIDPLHEFPLGDTPQAEQEREEYLSFDAGHGTFVTGVVQQLAPDADITVYRALDSDGLGSEVDVACAMLRAVIDDGNQILNLSLGCQTPDDFPPVAIQRALEIIRRWERDEPGREVLVVAAAGNFGDARPCWPAAFRDVVSVAALSPAMVATPWSSRGFWVTCSTVGQGLVSTFVEGTESPLLTPSPAAAQPPAGTAGPPEFTGDPPWAAWSGTSFAAPQITGAIAQLHAERPGSSLRDALRTLLASGRPLPGFGQAVQLLDGI